MRREDFENLVTEVQQACSELRDTKGMEYAGDDDALRNFKRTSEDCGIEPRHVWYVFAQKHWSSIRHFVRSGKVASEPIEGRINDLINYLYLLRGMVEESESRFEQKP
jgi:hypothetical protein